MNELLKTAVAILKFDEGWRSTPYYCTNDYPTIGYGFRIGDRYSPLPNFTLNRKVGDFWLEVEIETLCYQVTNYFSDVKDVVRQAVLVCMAYQMGFRGLLAFTNTCRLVKQGAHQEASIEMLESIWARTDSPLRALRYSKMYANNRLLEEYTS